MVRSTLGRIAVGAGVVIVVAIGLLMLAGRVAGPGLGAVSPADGAAFREPPGQVSLTFDRAVRPTQIHIEVTDRHGEPVQSFAPVTSGTTITEPLALHGDGDYVLDYHVTLADGRAVSGSNRFRVSSDLAVDSLPGARTAGAPAGHDHEQFADDPLNVVLIVVAGVAVAALLTMLIHRPQPRRPVAEE